MPTVMRRARRNPFEIFLLLACIVSGVAGLIDPARASGVVSRLLPHWELYLWYGGLAAGGITALVGVLAAGVASYAVERSGLIALTGVCLGYSTAVLFQAGAPAIFPATTVGLFGAACIVRSITLSRDGLRALAAEAQLRADLTSPGDSA